ncbi:MAG: CDP-alcohol phosphatidyltransferase family protein [Chloroflexota bacterium]
MLSKFFKERVRHGVRPLAASLARAGITPNALTIAGLLLSILVGIVLALGYEVAGGLLFLFAGLFDTLDGAVARLTGKVTVFGSFLDSTLDRYSEAFVFGGLLITYSSRGLLTEVVLVYAVIIGSLMVSYARARAEGLGLDCEVGWLQRPERIALLGLGLVFGVALPVLWLLAIFTNFTVAQRMVHVYRLTRQAAASRNGGVS